MVSAPFLRLMALFAVIDYAVDLEEIHLTLLNGSGLLTGHHSLAKHYRIIPPPPININQVFRMNSRGVKVGTVQTETATIQEASIGVATSLWGCCSAVWEDVVHNLWRRGGPRRDHPPTSPVDLGAVMILMSW